MPKHLINIATNDVELVIKLTAKQFAELHDDMTSYYNDHFTEIQDEIDKD